MITTTKQRDKKLTFDELLGHADQTDNICPKHSGDEGFIDIADVFHAFDVSGIVDFAAVGQCPPC